MKVFVSWSGRRSKMLAEALGPWLRRIVQSVEPWISGEMQKGVRSRDEIARALEDARVGLICLTPENLDSKWINFEAGALSKSPEIHVCTVLLAMAPADVSAPMDAFQHTRATRDDLLTLALTLADLARTHAGAALRDEDVRELFDSTWPKVEPLIQNAIAAAIDDPKDVRSQDEKIDEILELVRDLDKTTSRSKKLAGIWADPRRLAGVSDSDDRVGCDDRLIAAQPVVAARARELAALTVAGGFEDTFDSTMRALLADVFRAMGAHEGTVWLLDEGRSFLVPRFNNGPSANRFVGRFRQSVRSGMIGMVVSTELPICENQVYENRQQDTRLDNELGLQTCAMLAVPFYFAGDLRGVVTAVQLKKIGSKLEEPPGFTPQHLETLQLVTLVLARLVEQQIYTAALGLGDFE